MSTRPIREVEIGVSDLDRSLAFYTDLLGLAPLPAGDADDGHRSARMSAGTAVLRLIEIGAEGRTDDWITDDLQKGFRHIGFKVSDTDAAAARLRDAGVQFHLEPLDAEGGVRIAFFRDPDGVMLELIQGDLQYHKVWSEEQAADERSQGVPESPRFDHIAVTVEDLDKSLEFYTGALDYEVVGQLFQTRDPRGFVITYLRSENTVFEVFSYDSPKQPSPWQPGDDLLGFRAACLHCADAVEAEETASRLQQAGASGETGDVYLSPDGVPLKLVVQ
jgi:Predicted ring-cleavage extradiol dioxygenase